MLNTLKRITTLLIILYSIISVANDNGLVMIEDFSDCGTYRVREYKNHTPGTWFAADLSLSGAPNNTRPDGWHGVFSYDFDTTKKTGTLGFTRARASQVTAIAKGIEFYADRQGTNCQVQFVLKDAVGKSYYSKPVSLTGEGWHHYQTMLNKQTVKNYDQVVNPVKLKKIRLISFTTGKGTVLIDDIAFIGRAGRRNTLTIRSVYDGLLKKPNTHVKLNYRIRNSANKPLRGTIKAEGFNFDDEKVFSLSQGITFSAKQATIASFTPGILPVDSYYVLVSIEADKYSTSYIDWFGVFKGNNGRVNFKPMYFGVAELSTWSGDGERKLHIPWLRALGIDLVRYTSSGGRVEGIEGNTNGLPGMREVLDEYKKENILACFSYIESPPKWTQKEPYYYRSLPNIQDKFEKHIANLAIFLKEYPNVKYFEWWNEPDIGFLRDTLENYNKSMETVYKTFKKHNPDVMVGTGGVTVKHPKEKKNFSRDMYIKGKNFYDLAIFHAHGPMSNYVERQDMLDEWLKQAGKNCPVANTEAGERSGYKPNSIKRQAIELVKKLTYAKAQNTELYVWFTLQDYWDMDEVADDSFGLVTCDNQPKPSFLVYAELIRQLANTNQGKAEKIADNLHSYRFDNEKTGESTYVCWPENEGATTLLNFKLAGTGALFNIFGVKTELIPKNNYLSLVAPNHPFYLKVKTGSLQKAAPLISFTNQPLATPGEMVTINTKINNVFDNPVDVSINDMPSKQLKPNEAAIFSIAATAPDLKGKCTKSNNLKLSVKDATTKAILVNQQTPLCITPAYPVANTEKPLKLSIGTLNEVDELSYDPAILRWMGPEDLSVDFTATRDDKGIWFKFDIADNKHVQKQTGINIWRDDCVQLAIASKDGHHTELTAALTKNGPEIWRHISPKGEKNGPIPTQVDIKRVDGHTIYKFYLPFEALKISPEPGTPFRFAFLINENDGQGRVRWLRWFDGIGRGKDPAQFGWAIIK